MNGEERARYCAVLRVRPDADGAEIRRAYIRAVKRWHPDGQPPGKRAEYSARMQQINTAYARLRAQPSPLPPAEEMRGPAEPVRKRSAQKFRRWCEQFFDF